MSNDRNSNPGALNGRDSHIHSSYYAQAPDDDEQDYFETMNPETPGYISIKDYAYNQSNPLHYGYFEDSGSVSNDDEGEGSGDDTREDETNDELDRRQSIILPKDYVINQLAVALYDFEPENDNELGLKEGDIVFISYRHGQGWLVAENHERTKTGLVPEEFVTYLSDEDEIAHKFREGPEDGETARPFYLTHFITQGMNAQSVADADSTYRKTGDSPEGQTECDNWEDIDQLNENMSGKLHISHKEK